MQIEQNFDQDKALFHMTQLIYIFCPTFLMGGRTLNNLRSLYILSDTVGTGNDDGAYTWGINFASCRVCPSYSGSIETVGDLFLPRMTTVPEKWLPAGLSESPQEAVSRGQSRQEISLGMKH